MKVRLSALLLCLVVNAFALTPREEVRRLLADDFAALNRGTKTLVEVGNRARRLAETAKTPELSATLLAGAIRFFERAGEDARVVATRQRLEDCRHPFRVSSDAAVLKLGEFGEIDFVRCPTGTVELVLQWPKVRTRAVTISRPYWIAKYPLTRRQTAFFSPLIRLPFWCRWKAATADFGEDWCPIRLVIGQKVN